MKKIVIIVMLFTFTLLMFSASVYPQAVRILQTDRTAMTAPGNSAAVYVGGRYTNIMWYFTIASINTSVAVSLQVKSGTGAWTDVWADSLVFTSNGNEALEFDGIVLADSTRFRWISEAGGTAATITHNAILYGGN